MSSKNNNKDRFTNLIIVLVVMFIIGSFGIMVVKEIKVNSQNRIKEVSYKLYKDEISKDKYTIVLLGRQNCSHCANYKPLMNEVLKEYDLQSLYIDVNNLSKDDFYELHDSIKVLKDEYFDDGEPSIPTPTTIIFKNGVELESISANIGSTGFLNMLLRNGVIDYE